MTQVTKTDNRTIARLAKDIATMRRRIAAIARKHAKLQARIQKLEEAGRIIQLHKDAELVAGEGDVWYVKSDSLNTPDAEWNWYYPVICDEHGYQCGCETQGWNCKHTQALSNQFRQECEERRAAFVAAFDPCLVA